MTVGTYINCQLMLKKNKKMTENVRPRCQTKWILKKRSNIENKIIPKNVRPQTALNFLYEMISKKELKDFHKDIEQLEFRVTDSTKKSDTDIAFLIKKKYDIENPKEISKLEKPKRNEILRELKKECSERQIQRVTGVSRGVISKIK